MVKTPNSTYQIVLVQKAFNSILPLLQQLP